MTAVVEDLDLSWVTFSGDGDEGPCDGWGRDDCEREAVAVAVWAVPCGHQKERHRLCVEHRELVLAADRDPAREFACTACGVEIMLVRIDPIR